MTAYGKSETKTKSLLRALKITDADNSISLTSIGVMVLLTKIALAPTIDWAVAASLLLTLLSYNYKRHLSHKATQAAKADETKLEEVERKIAELNQAFAVKSMLR